MPHMHFGAGLGVITASPEDVQRQAEHGEIL
jgi:hypothetical protein